MASSIQFAVGDLVKLKSGGPVMTVRSLPYDQGKPYKCQWFAGKKLEQGDFPADSLEEATTQPPAAKTP